MGDALSIGTFSIDSGNYTFFCQKKFAPCSNCGRCTSCRTYFQFHWFYVVIFSSLRHGDENVFTQKAPERNNSMQGTTLRLGNAGGIWALPGTHWLGYKENLTVLDRVPMIGVAKVSRIQRYSKDLTLHVWLQFDFSPPCVFKCLLKLLAWDDA